MLRLYNSMSRMVEPFEPRDPNHVTMYVCGPTVYDFAHLGNARPVVVFDVLYRLLKRHYPKVTYVRNITDVDDKIMARAKESGESIDSITARTTQAYHDDMAALNTLPPDIEPRATTHIPQMVALCETLIAKGHAYLAEGHVLFHVPSMANYGALSRLSHDELIAGARVDVAPYKKDQADFVLWKPSAIDQPGWDSPWGRGRPGWHIECSAMAKQHLGITFDIHGGGLDLRFPHHENEIAQSCCAHDGAPLANYWLHNGFLSINGQKMSKSLGNFFTVRELLQKYHGEVIRLALLSAHYRQPLDFTEALLERSKNTLDSWYRALQRLDKIPEAELPEDSWDDFEIEEFLDDDLNTPYAISYLHGMATDLNKFTLQSIDDVMNAAINVKRRLFLNSATALGLLQHDPEAWFKWRAAGQVGLSDAEIEAQIAARLAARLGRNFADADRIRDELAAQNIILEDKAGATTWRRA